jgi:hypothetical protein
MEFDRYALIPLVMDFLRYSGDEESRSYYTSEQQEKILGYMRDTLGRHRMVPAGETGGTVGILSVPRHQSGSPHNRFHR